MLCTSPKIFQVQAKIVIVRPVFPDYIPVSHGYALQSKYLFFYTKVYFLKLLSKPNSRNNFSLDVSQAAPVMDSTSLYCIDVDF